MKYWASLILLVSLRYNIGYICLKKKYGEEVAFNDYYLIK